MSDQADKAELLRSLHVPGAPLVLSNAWDVGSARAVVDAGFPVVATASNPSPPGAAPDDLRAVVAEVGAPVSAGLALKRRSLDELRAIGLARVSVGPQLYRSALDHLCTLISGLSSRHEREEPDGPPLLPPVVTVT
ncbi:isocitrate lyase/phosphoenolpyruvate mutase family protein [Streptomyces sp. R21]|uniref:Isocitrate lyase/phosphoenolpyruvate mutase family protein n=1 Tax=Streptomyces sp. R21 TaxID=3238627 RepID=A0AB39P1V2_9ACTN